MSANNNEKSIGDEYLVLLGEIKGRLDEIVRQNGMQSSQLATQSIQIAHVATLQAGQSERLDNLGKGLKSLSDHYTDHDTRIRSLEHASVRHSVISGGLAAALVTASVEGLRQLLRMKGG